MRSRLGTLAQVAFAVCFMVAGPALIVWGAVAGVQHDRLVADGVRVEGTVIEFADVQAASKRRVTVAYVAGDGVTRRVFALADHEQHPKVGSTLTVAHDPKEPGRAAVVGYDPTTTSVLGMGVIITAVFDGLPLLLLAWLAFGGRKRRRDSRSASADAR